jgi:hypothetical protein
VAQLTNQQSQFVTPENILDNPGFQNGKTKWSVSTGSWSVAGSGLDNYASWDASASTQTFCSDLKTVPDRLKGKSGAALLNVSVPSGTATHKIEVRDGSANVLAQDNIFSNDTAVNNIVNFIFPTSGTVRVCLVAQADEPAVRVYSGVIADAAFLTVGQYAGAEFVGSLEWTTTTNCSWSTTSTSYSNFANDNDCDDNARITRGVFTDSSSGLRPEFSVPQLPPGNYIVHIEAPIRCEPTSASTSAQCYMRLTDGTNNFGLRSLIQVGGASSASLLITVPRLTFSFEQTSGLGSTTFNLQGLVVAGGRALLRGDDAGGLRISMYRYPLAGTQVFRADTVAQSGMWKFDSNCSWARTNTSLGDPTADASCDLTEVSNKNMGSVSAALSGGNKLPGIVWTAKSTGTYKICFYSRGIIPSAADTTSALNINGTNLVRVFATSPFNAGYQTYYGCYQLDATAGTAYTAKIQTRSSTSTLTLSGGDHETYFTIEALSVAKPAPLIENAVVSSYSGVTGVEYGTYTCAASSSLGYNPGGWMTGITNISSGLCTISVRAGTFSQRPMCYVTNLGTVTTQSRSVKMDSSSTATSLSIYHINQNGATTAAAGDGTYDIFCIGPR